MPLPHEAVLPAHEARTGQTFDSTNAASIALQFCDGIDLVAAAARDAGQVIDLRTAMRAIERLGSSFASASLVATYLGPGRHDALEVGYDMVWDSDCGCAAYPTRPATHPLTLSDLTLSLVPDLPTCASR